MELKYADLINKVEEKLVPTDGPSLYEQGEVVRLMNLIRNEAVDNGNINANAKLLTAVDFLEDRILEADGLDFEERVDLRDRFEVIRLTMNFAIEAAAWGENGIAENDDDEPTDVAVPVLTADEFYEPIFDALGLYLKTRPEPLLLETGSEG